MHNQQIVKICKWVERFTLRTKLRIPRYRTSFPLIRYECEDLQSKLPYSVWMRENTDQKNSNFGHFSCWVHLMTYGCIAEKQCFEKYCSCYKSCQFSDLSNRGYLEKPSIDEYKCVQLFLHQTIWSSNVTCSEEKKY